MEKLKGAVKFQREGSSSANFIWSDSEKLKRVFFFEALGTAIMSFAFTLSYFDYFARGIAYLMCFVLFYHISGAHFNPATTLAVYLKDQISGKY